MNSSMTSITHVIELPPDTQAFPGTLTLKDDIIRRFTNTQPRQDAEDENDARLQWTKSIPSVVLYEGNGINLYRDITLSKDYYLYNEEFEVITQHQEDIVSSILHDTLGHRTDQCTSDADAEEQRLLIADLGAGRLDKATVLLQSLAQSKQHEIAKLSQNIIYCAVDIQCEELHERLHTMVEKSPAVFRHDVQASHREGTVSVCGVCGSYDAFRSFLLGRTCSASQSKIAHNRKDASLGPHFHDGLQRHKCLLWLGSSFTNLGPVEAAKFLGRYIADGLMTKSDVLVIGLDKCQDVEKVRLAYGDNGGIWQKYVSNAMASAGRILGGEAARLMSAEDQWDYVSRWSSRSSRHMRFAVAKKAISFSVEGDKSFDRAEIDIRAGELIFVCESYKYSTPSVEKIFENAGLRLIKEWQLRNNDSSVYMLKLK